MILRDVPIYRLPADSPMWRGDPEPGLQHAIDLANGAMPGNRVPVIIDTPADRVVGTYAGTVDAVWSPDTEGLVRADLGIAEAMVDAGAIDTRHPAALFIEKRSGWELVAVSLNKLPGPSEVPMLDEPPRFEFPEAARWVLDDSASVGGTHLVMVQNLRVGRMLLDAIADAAGDQFRAKAYSQHRVLLTDGSEILVRSVAQADDCRGRELDQVTFIGVGRVTQARLAGLVNSRIRRAVR